MLFAIPFLIYHMLWYAILSEKSTEIPCDSPFLMVYLRFVLHVLEADVGVHVRGGVVGAASRSSILRA